MSQMTLSLTLPGDVTPVRTLVRQRLAAAVSAFTLSLRKSALRRELAALDDRQLRDAGIDLALAGRGKAAAVDAAALRHLQSLW